MDGKRQRREAAEQKEKERRNKQTAILFLFIIINNPEIWAPNHEPSNPLAFSSLVLGKGCMWQFTDGIVIKYHLFLLLWTLKVISTLTEESISTVTGTKKNCCLVNKAYLFEAKVQPLKWHWRFDIKLNVPGCPPKRPCWKCMLKGLRTWQDRKDRPILTEDGTSIVIDD